MFRNAISMALIAPVLIASLLAFSALPAKALSPDHYAESSRLGSGRWAKVKVRETGMQFISNATLRKLGFSDPSKVRVYGYGGRQLSWDLTEENPDDLPEAPSVQTSRGICFFGYDHIRWDYQSTGDANPFWHTMHSYAEESWYFIGESTEAGRELHAADDVETGNHSKPVSSFIQPLLHEIDQYHPADTGSRYLGEDFRSPTRRSFNFLLPDIVEGEDCGLKISFATNTSSSSTIEAIANGKPVEGTAAMTLNGTTDSETFMRIKTFSRTITDPGEKLRLDIAFHGGGTIKLARLDYIEVQYRRRLRMRNGELHFTLDAAIPSPVALDGVESSTVVWDITEPLRPKRVNFSLEGATAHFNTPKGCREYVAFTPDKCGTEITSGINVANQDLHALPIPDMLIISPAIYHDAARKLAAHHLESDGLECQILTPEQIYNEFSSGTPDITAFRRILKMWYDRGLALDASTDSRSEAITRQDDDTSSDKENGEQSRIKYCLILGKATFDNKLKTEATAKAGYPFVPIWQSATGESQTTSFSTDDYIGMLDDVKNFNIGTGKIKVAVGRMPFVSTSEAGTLVDKYLRYVTRPETGAWRNKVMMVADDQNYGDHLIQTEDMIAMFNRNANGQKMRYERIYLDSYPLQQSSRGPVYPQAKEKFLQHWNDGVMMISYIGHASVAGWTHEDLFNWTDITGMNNRKLPFLYAATCEFGRFDAATRSGAEVLWAMPESGTIASVVPSRSVYIDMNGRLSHQVAISMMKADGFGLPRRIGDIFTEAKNNYPAAENTNRLRYAMIGDPAMRLPVPQYDVRLDSINGTDLREIESPADFPILPAQSRAELAGEIRNPDGSPATGFNGTLEIHLYDAENVVGTYGNGEAGAVSYYNDRATMLYHGVTKVKDGKWSLTALLPSEIQNNYSPAQFIFYAYSDKGEEAHGENSGFYVYGAEESETKDTTGPEISLFGLNHEGFASGDIVHSSPVVMARVSDPSGINLSDAGIGHKITLMLDDKKIFDDVNTYYSPDPDDFTAGSICYPLSDIAPGSHRLRLTVWDNAKNSSSAEIEFGVAVSKAPEIYSVTTDVNPARNHVNFTLSTDRPMATVDCTIEVFDLGGRRVWSSSQHTSTDMSAGLAVGWNLCDVSGVRVPRGIYLYRATVESPEGPSATKTQKLAVTAP